MTGFLTEPPGNGSRLDKVEEAFRLVVKLLRSKHLRESGFQNFHLHNSQGENQCGDIKTYNERLQDIASFLESPRLSLRHEGHLKMDQKSRVQAEQEAVLLLARPVRVHVESQACEESLRIGDLSKLLMNGMYETFAILVDSRLRVYAKVFYRHLTSLMAKQTDAFGTLQMGQKLETLHDIGGQITALSMEMNVQLQDEEPDEVTPGIFQQALHLEATMELLVPNPAGPSRTFCVRHKTQGYLKGVIRSDEKKLEIYMEVNTKDLLSSMMDQASLMVAEIVKTTNEAFCLPEPKLSRGESFLAMPPPLPRKQQPSAQPPLRAAPPKQLDGLDLLSRVIVARESVVITPDLHAKNSDATVIPSLCLDDEATTIDEEEDDENTANVDNLSVDQCASIVDDVFGGMDDLLLRQGPPLKKARKAE